MPLIKFHIYRGQWIDELEALLDTVHEVMVRTFQVPERDRYQIVFEHDQHHLRALDTGLDIPRTERFVMLEILSRPRSAESKMTFYSEVCVALGSRFNLADSDVMISFTINSDEDWSFGRGRAQFMTNEL